MPEEPKVNQTENQRKIAFAQSEHVETVIQLMKESTHQGPLLGATEYETVVNASRLDAQSDMINKFINMVDSIKRGGLFEKQ